MLFSSRKTAGIIGLGIIGTRVAQNLRTAGHTVYVYNRSPRPVPNFLGSPAQVAEHCHFIQIFVRDSEDLMEIMERLAQGSLGEKHIVINSATVAPEAVERAASIALTSGAGFVNAPFMGSKAAAEKGTLIYFVGGEESLIKKVQPILSASAREIVPAGSIRQAALMKLAANMLISLQVAGLAEVLGFVERGGIAPERFLKALDPTIARSPVMDMKSPGILAQDYEPHFTMANMLKDSRLAAEAARRFSQDTPLSDAVNGVFSQGVAQGLGELDFSAIAKLFLPSQALREPAPTAEIVRPEPEEAAPVTETLPAAEIETAPVEKIAAPLPLLAAEEAPDFVVLPPPEPDFDALPRTEDPPRIAPKAPGSRIARLDREMRSSPLARRITPLPPTPAVDKDWEPVKRQMDLPLSMPPPPPPAVQIASSETVAPAKVPQDLTFTFTQEDVDSLPTQGESPLVAAKPVLPGHAKLPHQTPFIPNRPKLPEDEEPA